MKIFRVVTWNKSVVYFLLFTKECILNLLTLFFKRLIKTISCFHIKKSCKNVYPNWLTRVSSSHSANSLWLYVYGSEFLVRRKQEECLELIIDVYFILSIKGILDRIGWGAQFMIRYQSLFEKNCCRASRLSDLSGL